MSPLSDMFEQEDLIWKALADGTRRSLLDHLVEGPLTTGELVKRTDGLCRTAVMKHLDVLARAKLILVRRQGRLRFNYLNPVPIQQVCERWIRSMRAGRLTSSLLDLKEHVEAEQAKDD